MPELQAPLASCPCPGSWLGLSAATWLGLATLLAIILGPVIAVQFQKWTERRRDTWQKKVQVFHTLMATRGNRFAARHIDALNTIELEFRDTEPVERRVNHAWKQYLKTLGEPWPNEEADQRVLVQRRNDLFNDLLFEISETLKLGYTKLEVQSVAYLPSGHGQPEYEQTLIRQRIIEVLDGQRPIPITVHQPPPATGSSSEESSK